MMSYCNHSVEPLGSVTLMLLSLLILKYSNPSTDMDMPNENVIIYVKININDYFLNTD
jgi:hypothetical protein